MTARPHSRLDMIAATPALPPRPRRGTRLGHLLVAVGLAVSVLVSADASPAVAHPVAMEEGTTAPEAWGRELTYRLRFRLAFDFLSDDISEVMRLMISGGNADAQAMLGLEMTDEEWAEMERRLDLASQLVPVMRAVTGRAFDEAEERLEGQARLEGSRLPTGPVFGGIWQDQMDGGRIKLAVTSIKAVNVASLVAMFPRGLQDFEIIEQAYSLDQLYEWRSWVLARKSFGDVWGGVGFDYSDAGVRLRLVVYPERLDVDLERVLMDIPRDAVVVEIAEGVPSDFNEPQTQHGDSDLMAGIQIGVVEHPQTPNWDAGCTWGASGHTSDYTYIVTAGHCMTPHASVISGWNQRAVEQNWLSGRVISTAGGAFTYGRNFDSGATLDHGRISSSWANTNCTHGTILNWLAHCPTGSGQPRITQRLSLYGHSHGQVVCASLGFTNDYNCGTVDDVDLGGFDIYRDGVGWVTVYNRITVNGLCSGPGDSGAGVVAGATLHGLLSGGDQFTCWMYFEPAYYVKAYMGATSFDFNCVRSGSWWGACPVVYS